MEPAARHVDLLVLPFYRVDKRKEEEADELPGIAFGGQDEARIAHRRPAWTRRTLCVRAVDAVTMELAFNSLRLRSRCEDPDDALQVWKPAVVDQLQSRLADIRAAGSPLDLVAGSPKLTDGSVPTVSILLAETHVLTCVVGHAIKPKDEFGNIEWDRVRRLKVMSIEEVCA